MHAILMQLAGLKVPAPVKASKPLKATVDTDAEREGAAIKRLPHPVFLAEYLRHVLRERNTR